jgi:hypothetical protein
MSEENRDNEDSVMKALVRQFLSDDPFIFPNQSYPNTKEYQVDQNLRDKSKHNDTKRSREHSVFDG